MSSKKQIKFDTMPNLPEKGNVETLGEYEGGKDYGMQIVAVEGEFVYVGRTRYTGPMHGHKGFVVIHDAINLRIWGTERGLGELANGPTDKTQSDPTGIVAIPFDKVILFVQVLGDAWVRKG